MSKKILDYNFLKKFHKDFELNTFIKKSKKGISVFAKKDIKKGNIVAYYKIKLYTMEEKINTKSQYTMTVYTKSDNISNKLIGDICEESLDIPRYGIPYWGYLLNEPSPNEKVNCYFDSNIKINYKNRNVFKRGDYMIYKLITLKDVKKGEELCVCYVDAYNRNYKTSCPI
jgi:hypothetical protein